jgi:hypothetical protein
MTQPTLAIEPTSPTAGEPIRGGSPAPLILVAPLGKVYGSRGAAAALACALSEPDSATLLIDFGGAGTPRPTLLSTGAARELEARLHYMLPGAPLAARGAMCHLALPADAGGLQDAAHVRLAHGLPAVVVHLPSSLLHSVLDADPGLDPRGVLLRADLGEDRSALAGAVREMRARGLAVAVLKRRLDWMTERRALFGALANRSPDALPERLVARLLDPGQVGKPNGRALPPVSCVGARAGNAPLRGCQAQGSEERRQ